MNSAVEFNKSSFSSPSAPPRLEVGHVAQIGLILGSLLGAVSCVNGAQDKSDGPLHSNVTVTSQKTGPVETTVAPQFPENPFKGAALYVDPNSDAAQQQEEWATDRPEDAALLGAISSQFTAKWFGDWNDDIRLAVDDYATEVTDVGALPVMVAYNIPYRDCGGLSGGGAENDEAYATWVADFAAGIGNRKAVVIVEPDALMLDCLYETATPLLRDAVALFSQNYPNVSVYIDAGHPNAGIESLEMAARLVDVGVSSAHGFAVNTSNFETDAVVDTYAAGILEEVGISTMTYITDTSRNGNGPDADHNWCNPLGRALGENPNTEVSFPVDARLWIKYPGSSDGECNGGPAAGDWWAEYAVELAENAL